MIFLLSGTLSFFPFALILTIELERPDFILFYSARIISEKRASLTLSNWFLWPHETHAEATFPWRDKARSHIRIASFFIFKCLRFMINLMNQKPRFSVQRSIFSKSNTSARAAFLYFLPRSMRKNVLSSRFRYANSSLKRLMNLVAFGIEVLFPFSSCVWKSYFSRSVSSYFSNYNYYSSFG